MQLLINPAPAPATAISLPAGMSDGGETSSAQPSTAQRPSFAGLLLDTPGLESGPSAIAGNARGYNGASTVPERPVIGKAATSAVPVPAPQADSRSPGLSAGQAVLVSPQNLSEQIQAHLSAGAQSEAKRGVLSATAEPAKGQPEKKSTAKNMPAAGSPPLAISPGTEPWTGQIGQAGPIALPISAPAIVSLPTLPVIPQVKTQPPMPPQPQRVAEQSEAKVQTDLAFSDPVKAETGPGGALTSFLA